MKYKLLIERKITHIGSVEIEAESKEDAERKYWEPDYSKGEEIIFDSEIDWDEIGADYEIVKIKEINDGH